MTRGSRLVMVVLLNGDVRTLPISNLKIADTMEQAPQIYAFNRQLAIGNDSLLFCGFGSEFREAFVGPGRLLALFLHQAEVLFHRFE